MANINERLARYGLTCPICGMHLIDLQHDGYDGEDENYHEFCCTACNIDFDVTVNASEIIELT